jgi:membrane dipeptidase
MTIELDRRFFIGAAAAAALVPAAAPAAKPGRRLPVINALGGLFDPNHPDKDESGAGVAGTPRKPIEQRVIDDALASGTIAVNNTLGYVAGPMDPFEFSVAEIGIWDWRIRHHRDRLLKVLTAADILRARDEGKLGIIYGFQNAAMMGDKVERADTFADLGVRVFQLTYNPANQVGDGSMAPGNRGLTPFGRRLVERLNDNRVMVDLSHSGERTCLEAARVSRQPVSINHTGCRALTDLPRNKTDEELRLVVSRGGFVGIYFMPFLSPRSVATAEDVVRHIDHAVNVCGEDHVGIGTDGGTTAIDDMAGYRAHIRKEVADRKAAGIGAAGENPETLPFVEALQGPDQFRKLAGLLRARGYGEGRVEKIMSLNFLRYAREIWGA